MSVGPRKRSLDPNKNGVHKTICSPYRGISLFARVASPVHNLPCFTPIASAEEQIEFDLEKFMFGRPTQRFRCFWNIWRPATLAGMTLLLLLLSIPMSAQVLYGSLTGQITDKTGAVVPNAAITLTDQNTGAVRTTTAGTTGVYMLLNVLPGVYTVSVAPTQNFAAFSQKNIQIEPNRQVRSDIALNPGGVSTQITVTEAPAALQTETAEVNSEISKDQLAQLPMTSSGGRNFQALYTLIPGGTSVGEQNSTASNPSRSMSVNVNGADNQGNTTRIDGAVNYYGWLPYLIAYVPPADSIENVSITTNSFDAEQGQAGGASIKITTKGGTSSLHGGAWEYYQDAGLNARGYTNTKAALRSAANPTGSVPKNVFDQFGFNIGGPVYIPRILTGKKKLFFFDNFERTTRRQLAATQLTLPDSTMTTGNFSEAAPYTTLYDPAPTVAASQWFTPSAACPALTYTNGFLNYKCRPSFTQEYGETGNSVNTIPASRIAAASAVMMTNLANYAKQVPIPTATMLSSGMANDYFGIATVASNRNTNDVKINYVPSDDTQVYGKYSIEPFSILDPQVLGAAEGGTADGGQPGNAHGTVQNVGLGGSHVFTPHLVLDSDFGYTRQNNGVQDPADIARGNYGTDVLGIPGTNGTGKLYAGEPPFFMNGFSTLGNNGLANPFLFRDNQFTGDVNLSWIKGKHSTKYGFTVYHFLLNHFQPTSGGGVTNVRGGFYFQGNMTCSGTGSACPVAAYNGMADFLLGLPNYVGSQAVAKATSIFNPNSMRWWEYGAYAQDQWTVSKKLTLSYGVRYELYPPAYRDHSGLYIADPNRPQASNVEIGGVGGNPESAGVDMGHGFFAPRLGVIYRLNDKTVLRSGFGITTDPDSLRYMRDSYPVDLAVSYTSSSVGTIAIDPSNTTHYATGEPMTFAYGIPALAIPNLSSGFVSLPLTGSTTTVPKNFRRGYLESWNLFVQRDLGHQLVASVGYVGNHMVRQQATVSPYNSAPLPSGATSCMANGQWNPSTGLTGSCSFQVNTIFSQKWCNGTSNCYNSGGMTIGGPIFSSMYDSLQSQLSRNVGTNGSFGVVYAWSHAIDYADNGAGTGGGGVTFNYPGMYAMNKGNAGFDRRQNLQVWSIYNLPFGHGQKYVNHGFLSQIIGGFGLNGQFSHTSGAPFSVSSNSNVIGGLAPGFNTTYAQLVAPYQQQGGHNRVFGSTAVSGGKAWFNPAAFASVTEPTLTASMTPSQIPALVLPNTKRDQFTGPGLSMFNASADRSFHIYRESAFRVRVEAFNLFNHPWVTNPNTTVPSAANVASGNYGTFGLITSYGPSFSPNQGARSLQFSGRYTF